MEQPELFNVKPKPPRKPPQEYKLVALRDCPVPDRLKICDTPQLAADYWRQCIVPAPWYSHDRECFVVILLNTRLRILGHHLVAVGSLDNVVIHPREVFRAAIVAACHSIVVGHNHPSGDPTPSDADIVITRALVRAARLLKIPINDHVIIGGSKHSSLEALGLLRE